MRVKLDEGAIMPTRAHDADAGLDLYAREDKVVPAGGSAVFDTGVHVELPYLSYDRGLLQYKDGITYPVTEIRFLKTTGLIKSKSGLNVKHNITSEGVIDYEYTGPIIVKLYNHGTEDYSVRKGDKISQLVIVPVMIPELELAEELEETERGNNGFGSSGR